MAESATAPSPAAPKVAARMATVSPEMASKLLKRNVRNRQVSRARVEQYAADMRRGDWQLNGEAIKVAHDGRILDGQHRLLACIEADATFQTLFITGLPDEAQETMDQGRARTFGDVLRLRGEQYYQPVSGAVRMLCVYEKTGLLYVVSGKDTPTVQQMSRYLDRNPGVRDSVAYVYRYLRRWIPAVAMCGMHFLFSAVDEEAANDFVHKLATGENLDGTSPIYVLRERLIEERAAAGNGRELHHRVKLAFFVLTWNAYMTGDHIERLAWTPGGAKPDPFPEIHGLGGPAS